MRISRWILLTKRWTFDEPIPKDFSAIYLYITLGFTKMQWQTQVLPEVPAALLLMDKIQRKCSILFAIPFFISEDLLILPWQKLHDFYAHIFGRRFPAAIHIPDWLDQWEQNGERGRCSLVLSAQHKTVEASGLVKREWQERFLLMNLGIRFMCIFSPSYFSWDSHLVLPFNDTNPARFC